VVIVSAAKSGTRAIALASADTPGYAAVLGDVVRSRHADVGFFDRLHQALGHANERIDALQPLQITIGDEFQGVYRRLGDALNTTLLLRLLLHDVVDVRFGIGWGTFTRWVPERAPYEQDGPAWWAAREALKEAVSQEARPGTPAGWLTAIRLSPASSDEPANQLELPVTTPEQLERPRPLDLLQPEMRVILSRCGRAGGEARRRRRPSAHRLSGPLAGCGRSRGTVAA
jgi:hypothetical protein